MSKNGLLHASLAFHNVSLLEAHPVQECLSADPASPSLFVRSLKVTSEGGETSTVVAFAKTADNLKLESDKNQDEPGREIAFAGTFPAKLQHRRYMNSRQDSSWRTLCTIHDAESLGIIERTFLASGADKDSFRFLSC